MPRVAQQLSPTEKMVDQTLSELHTLKGNSLVAIKKHIAQKFTIEISKTRYTNIKNYLRALLERGALINVSGRGLAGRVRFSPAEYSRRQRRGRTLGASTRQTSEHKELRPQHTKVKTRGGVKRRSLRKAASKTEEFSSLPQHSPQMPPHMPSSIFETPLSSRDNTLETSGNVRKRKLINRKLL